MAQKIVGCLLLFFFSGKLLSQNICTNPGQTPATAIPLCNNNPIHQSTVPTCRNSSVFVPGCSNQNTSYNDNNPIYYRFTCFGAGTLGFVITPDKLTEDFDWQLFDITDKNPTDIYINNTLIVSGNWSGSLGLTGASSSGVNFIQCRSDPFFGQTPTFAEMPVLKLQHNYLLLVAHSDSLQGGYSLSFSGGTANITDQLQPAIIAGNPDCSNSTMLIKLNKKIKCSSIATDGSDFSLFPANATVVSAVGSNCSNSFESDSIYITFNRNIPPGNYTLKTGNGTDGNTLLDQCNNSISTGNQLSFTVSPLATLDSLTPVGCSPDKLSILLKKNIQCSSVAADGSDFIITGTVPVSIISATGVCNNNSTNSIELKLSQPILNAGNFTIILKTGLDGNTILDECGFAIPAGTKILFSTKDTVSADFSLNIHAGCTNDTVLFLYNGNNQINSWLWSFENGTSSLQNTTTIYTTGGTKLVQLIVSNGLCSDTSSKTFLLNEKVKAGILGPDILCPEDAATFKDNSSNATSWSWNFSNGITSTEQNPLPQKFPFAITEKTYQITLTAGDGKCFSTASHFVKVATSCYVTVPTAFTPNGDNLNDYLYPLNAFQADHLEFKVYNRLGQLVFTYTDGLSKWDGTYKGSKQSTGTYVWLLNYTQRNSGQKISMKGTTLLIR